MGSHDCRSAKKLAQHAPFSDISAKKFAQHARKRPFWANVSVQGELFHAFTMTQLAGRTFSRTRHDNVATLKPTTPLRAPEQQPLKPRSPLLTPNKGPLKPASPLRPKTAPKTPISHPQRRWRFQSRLGRRPQRRWRFQSRLGRRPQRRRRFQTTGPAGLQGLAAAPVGGVRARPGDRWADDVTNVVKPARFKSPREGLLLQTSSIRAQKPLFSKKKPPD